MYAHVSTTYILGLVAKCLRKFRRQLRMHVVCAVITFAVLSVIHPNGTALAQVRILHSFSGSPGAAVPLYPPIQGSDGLLYGTTLLGGTSDAGTAFRTDATGTVTVLHSFSGTLDGRNPLPLIQASDNLFYGTTAGGGTFDNGTVFRMDATGAVTVLHSFSKSPESAREPRAGIIQANDGFFYGTTISGGNLRGGTVFRMDSTGAVTVLHSFNPFNFFAGANPRGSLIQASDGFFYGHTSTAIFRMSPAGMVTVLHSFSGAPTDGESPWGGLMEATDGFLYGLTQNGGAFNTGTAFRIDPTTGSLAILHSFDPSTTGDNPVGPLLQASDGLLYGPAQSGGAFGFGTVFRMDTAGAVSVLHSFSDTPSDGVWPGASLVQAADGGIYGVTEMGGTNGQGTIFKVTIVPEDMEQCMKEGYLQFGPPAGPFKNQGECVSYVERNSRAR